MNGEVYTATEPQVKFDGPPWTEPDLTDEEIAEEIAWNEKFAERCRRLNEIEPLPDNFEALCEGRETVPVYSKARAS
jgi:hypothetical protein